MKTYATLFAALFMCSYAAAQKPYKVKESTFHEVYGYSFQTHESLVGRPLNIPKQGGKDLVRLYKYKNSRIKKALSFTTPRNKAKLT